MIKEIFQKYTETITNIKESRLKSQTQITKVKRDLIDSSLKRLESEDQITKVKEARKYRRSVKKTRLLSVVVFFGCVGSTLASLAGTGKMGDPITPELIALVGMVVFAQIIVFYGSIIATTIKYHYRQHYFGLKSIQMLMLIISIYFNYGFMLDYMPNKLVCLALCIIFDYAIIRYLSLIHDIKNDIKDEKMQDPQNILQMAWYNFTSKLRRKIVSDYKKNLELEISDKPIEISNAQNMETKISDVTNEEPSRLMLSESQQMETEISDNDSEISNIILVKQKITEFQTGERISVSSFKEMGINSKDWRKLRNELLKEKIIYTESSNTYKA